MSIHFNPASATAQRHLAGTQGALLKATQRLASGLRVNSAADDAAGLAMSQRLRAQVGGMNQARRNVQDGLSYLQTAEGGLSQMGDILARMRELAVQAGNDVFSTADKTALQAEVDQAVAEIDRIASSTLFGSRNVLGNASTLTKVGQVVEALRRSALRASEDLIERYYGLVGDGVTLTVKTFDDAADPRGAFMQSTGTTLELHVNLGSYANFGMPDGGDISIFEFDRVVAHEMVHGLMFRTMDTSTFPDWFVEGTAEYIHGVDDRLKNDLDAVDGNSANGYTAADITTFLNNGWDVAASGSPQYSASYAAVKYLDSKLATAGTSIKSLMDQLEGGSTLDAALTATIGMNAASFVTDFKTNGVTFIQGLNLTDSDMGGIGGGDGTATVPDLNWDTVQPLNRFNVIWPDGTPEPALTLQAGANNVTADTIDLSGIVISASILGVTGLDLHDEAGEALDLIDSALTGVASGRARLGAIQNRLEYALTSLGIGAESLHAADSRIRDADVAATMADFVRTQILQNTGLAALSQANAAPSLVTALLN